MGAGAGQGGKEGTDGPGGRCKAHDIGAGQVPAVLCQCCQAQAPHAGHWAVCLPGPALQALTPLLRPCLPACSIWMTCSAMLSYSQQMAWDEDDRDSATSILILIESAALDLALSIEPSCQLKENRAAYLKALRLAAKVADMAMWCRGSLAEGHCLIVPSEHVASTRKVDEAVWTELRNFKKALLQMAMSQVGMQGCICCRCGWAQHAQGPAPT